MSALQPDIAMAIDHGLQLFPCTAPAPTPTGCSCSDPKCDSPGKHPAVTHWAEIATTGRAQIERWTRRYAGCNWGVATGIKSGVFVVDVDPYHAGAETLASLEDEFGPLPATWEVLTGGGGRHLYFRHPGIQINNSIGVIGPGIDGRGDGGLVIAPPSRHKSGRAYAWNVDANPDELALADLPAWVIARLDRPHVQANGRPPEEWLQLVTDPVTESRRSDRLVKLAGHLLRRFVDPVVTLELLTSWNAARCSPPIDDAELKEAIERICELEMTRRRGGSHG